MTLQIPQDDRETTIAAAAGQTALDSDFPVIAADDVAVYLVRADTITTLAQPADYAVSLVDNQNGFRVTLVVAALDGDTYVLRGERAGGRVSAFSSGGFSADDLNRELNAQEIELLEMRRDVDASLKPAPGDASGAVDGGNRRASNFADGSDATDLVTKQQLEGATTGIVDQAQAAASAAQQAEQATQTLAGQVSSAATAASNSAATASAAAATLDLPPFTGNANKLIGINSAGTAYEARDGGAVSSVNGQAGDVIIDATEVDVTGDLTPANYTPAASDIEGHLDGSDNAFGAISTGNPGDIMMSFDAAPLAGFVELNGATITNGATANPGVAARYPWMVSGVDLVLPDMRGDFPRGWDNGAGNDPDAASRTGRAGDGATGDLPGTHQADEFKSHTHGISDNIWYIASGSSANRSRANNSEAKQSTARGGTETRPRNIAVMFTMRLG